MYVCICIKYRVKQSFSFLSSCLPPFLLPNLCVKFMVLMPKKTHFFVSVQIMIQQFLDATTEAELILKLNSSVPTAVL